MNPAASAAGSEAARPRRLYAVAPPAGMTGGAICALEHLQVLRPDFEECILVMSESSPLAARAQQAGIPVWCSPFINRGLRRAGPLRFFRYIREVAQSRWAYFTGLRRLLKEKPGIVHIHSRAAHLPYSLLAAKLAHVPAVVTLHEPWDGGFEAWTELALVRLLADKVILLTRAMVVQHPRCLRRAEVVPNHAELPPPRTGSGNARPLLAIVGRMVKSKGTDVFLEVCRRLAAAGQNYDAWMVGAWPVAAERAEAERLLAECQLQERVAIRGPREDMADVYRRMDLLLLPTRRDSFPRVVMEAMCQGVPVVATRVDGVPEMVVDGQTGFLVEPGNVDGFVEKTAQLLGDPELRRRMGAAGRERARQIFAPQAYRNMICAIYADLGGRNRERLKPGCVYSSADAGP